MSEDVQHQTGLIGPNAILQLLPIIDRLGGQERCAQLLASAGVFHTPTGSDMIPEGDAARLHRQLRLEEPELAPALTHHAGLATADYILCNRIPGPAQMLLKLLPPQLSARLLSHAIARHAWTFAGSGTFSVLSPTVFEIQNNPLVAHERSDVCLCHWHTAVFTRLYQTLVAPDFVCRETTCRAQGPGIPCRFELRQTKPAQDLTDIKVAQAAVD